MDDFLGENPIIFQKHPRLFSMDGSVLSSHSTLTKSKVESPKARRVVRFFGVSCGGEGETPPVVIYHETLRGKNGGKEISKKGQKTVVSESRRLFFQQKNRG